MSKILPRQARNVAGNAAATHTDCKLFYLGRQRSMKLVNLSCQCLRWRFAPSASRWERAQRGKQHERTRRNLPKRRNGSATSTPCCSIRGWRGSRSQRSGRDGGWRSGGGELGGGGGGRRCHLGLGPLDQRVGASAADHRRALLEGAKGPQAKGAQAPPRRERRDNRQTKQTT